MKRQFELLALLLLGCIMFSCPGCHTETAKDSPPHWSCVPISSNYTIYWMEVEQRFDPNHPHRVVENRFYTNDLARAQSKVPFPIVLPGYIPVKVGEIPLPHIEGPLSAGSDNKTEVIIRYEIYSSDDAPSKIFITEANYTYSMGDPELNSYLAVIEIGNKQVVTSEPNNLSDQEILFCFDSEGIYFLVRTYNLHADEAMKVVASIIEQIELGPVCLN